MNDKDKTNPSQRQASPRPHELDHRYGKIGISAVAAAVRHQSEPRTVTEPHLSPYDRD